MMSTYPPCMMSTYSRNSPATYASLTMLAPFDARSDHQTNALVKTSFLHPPQLFAAGLSPHRRVCTAVICIPGPGLFHPQIYYDVHNNSLHQFIHGIYTSFKFKDDHVNFAYCWLFSFRGTCFACRIESSAPKSDKARRKRSPPPTPSKHKRHHQKLKQPPPMLGTDKNDIGTCDSKGHSDNSVKCIAAVGSVCQDMSGGAINDPRCTCNTAADCPPAPDPKNKNDCRASCGPWPGSSTKKTYKGNVCNYDCKTDWSKVDPLPV